MADTSRHAGRCVRISYARDRVAIGWLRNWRDRSSDVPRGTVREFSAKSRQRLRSYLANSAARYAYLGTLTVADDVLSAVEFKDALHRFLQWFLGQMQGAAPRRGESQEEQSVCWFLEFQRRGAPHVHFLYTSPVPWRRAASKWTTLINQPWAFQTSTKFEALRGSKGSAMAYATKYAAKVDQKELPENIEAFGRWWGVRGMRDVVSAELTLELTDENHQEVSAMLRVMSEACSQAETEGLMRSKPWKYGGGVSYYPVRIHEGLWKTGVGHLIDACVTTLAINAMAVDQEADQVAEF